MSDKPPRPGGRREDGAGGAARDKTRCQLYLIGPAGQASPTLIEQALDAAEVACVLLRSTGAPSNEARAAVSLVQARGVACLLEDAAVAASLGADGVHLAQIQGYDEARALLGTDRIVGVACESSRHLAMEAGERGADYVAFRVTTADDIETLRDWSDTTIVPCVAWMEQPDLAAEAIASGAEFLAVGDVWTDPGGPAGALRAYASQLGQAERRL